MPVRLTSFYGQPFEDTKNAGFVSTSAKGVKASTALNGGLNGGVYQKDSARNFLKLLEKDGMILHESLSKSTRITVCNYDTYQSDLHVWANDWQTLSKR